MQQIITKHVADYCAPASEVIVLASNACLCASPKKGNGLDTLDGEEW